MSSKNQIFCDQLIIGSGPGGSVVFDQLTSAGFAPMIIEEGKAADDKSFQDNPAKLTFQYYRNGGVSPILGSPIFPHGEARVLGGGSTINGGLMWRTPENIKNEWRRPLQEIGINDNEIYKFFDDIDNYMDIKNQEVLNNFDLDSNKLLSGANKLNWNVVPARRAVQSCQRRNQCGAGCPSGAKRSMIKSCLSSGLKNGGIIKTQLRVEKIIVNNSKVTEVLCTDLSKSPYEKISIIPSDIFLCAGTLETPKLLLRSKILKAKSLRLGLHLNLRFLAKFSDKINSDQGTMFTYQVQQFLDQGIIIMASNLRKMYLSTILSKLDTPLNQKILNNYPYLGLYTTTLRPSSYGGFLKLPFLNAFPYFSPKKEDLSNLKLASIQSCRLLFAAGAEYILLPFSKPQLVTSFSEASNYINNADKNDFDFLSVHAMSSLPITNKKLMTNDGRLKGISNLYISDGSLLPSTIGESPQQTIMAFSHYISERWINRHIA
jgi:hypothetical protein